MESVIHSLASTKTRRYTSKNYIPNKNLELSSHQKANNKALADFKSEIAQKIKKYVGTTVKVITDKSGKVLASDVKILKWNPILVEFSFDKIKFMTIGLGELSTQSQKDLGYTKELEDGY